MLAILTDLTAADVPTGTGWVRMRCPFHQDRTASASVNHDIGRFKCFSCDTTGDGLDLIQQRLGLSFTEAVERAKQLNSTQSDRPRRRVSDLLRQEFGG